MTTPSEPQRPCRLWTGTKDQDGYGMVRVPGVGMRRVHRVEWEKANGPIPAGMLVCHRCDVPGCYELSHLFLGTKRDNRRDAMAKGRLPRFFGATNPAAKLTAEQVQNIRATVRTHPTNGQEIRAAAQRLGVHPGTLWLVLTGQTWRDTQ